MLKAQKLEQNQFGALFDKALTQNDSLKTVFSRRIFTTPMCTIIYFGAKQDSSGEDLFLKSKRVYFASPRVVRNFSLYHRGKFS